MATAKLDSGAAAVIQLKQEISELRNALQAAAAVHNRDLRLLRQLGPSQAKQTAQIAAGMDRKDYQRSSPCGPSIKDAPPAYGFTGMPPDFGKQSIAELSDTEVRSGAYMAMASVTSCSQTTTEEEYGLINPKDDTTLIWKEKYLAVFNRMLQLNFKATAWRAEHDRMSRALQAEVGMDVSLESVLAESGASTQAGSAPWRGRAAQIGLLASQLAATRQELQGSKESRDSLPSSPNRGALPGIAARLSKRATPSVSVADSRRGEIEKLKADLAAARAAVDDARSRAQAACVRRSIQESEVTAMRTHLQALLRKGGNDDRLIVALQAALRNAALASNSANKAAYIAVNGTTPSESHTQQDLLLPSQRQGINGNKASVGAGMEPAVSNNLPGTADHVPAVGSSPRISIYSMPSMTASTTADLERAAAATAADATDFEDSATLQRESIEDTLAEADDADPITATSDQLPDVDVLLQEAIDHCMLGSRSAEEEEEVIDRFSVPTGAPIDMYSLQQATDAGTGDVGGSMLLDSTNWDRLVSEAMPAGSATVTGAATGSTSRISHNSDTPLPGGPMLKVNQMELTPNVAASYDNTAQGASDLTVVADTATLDSNEDMQGQPTSTAVNESPDDVHRVVQAAPASVDSEPPGNQASGDVIADDAGSAQDAGDQRPDDSIDLVDLQALSLTLEEAATGYTADSALNEGPLPHEEEAASDSPNWPETSSITEEKTTSVSPADEELKADMTAVEPVQVTGSDENINNNSLAPDAGETAMSNELPEEQSALSPGVTFTITAPVYCSEEDRMDVEEMAESTVTCEVPDLEALGNQNGFKTATSSLADGEEGNQAEGATAEEQAPSPTDEQALKTAEIQSQGAEALTAPYPTDDNDQKSDDEML